MCRQTKAIATAFILSLLAPPALAASDLVENFVTCQGRFAAQEDYDRLMGRDIAETSARAQMFGELVASILPVDLTDDARRAIRRTRTGAEGAHWTLLHSADFSMDARLARHADSTARRNIAMCEMLVLG